MLLQQSICHFLDSFLFSCAFLSFSLTPNFIAFLVLYFSYQIFHGLYGIMPSVAKRSCDALSLINDTNSKRLKTHDEICYGSNAQQNSAMEMDAYHISSPHFHQLRPLGGISPKDPTRNAPTPMEVVEPQPRKSLTMTFKSVGTCSRCLAGEPGHIKHALLG